MDIRAQSASQLQMATDMKHLVDVDDDEDDDDDDDKDDDDDEGEEEDHYLHP